MIITDCSMPFMDGYEASKLIREMLAEYSDDVEDLQNVENINRKMSMQLSNLINSRGKQSSNII